MKQNKQSICLAAPPLRQCVFLGYLLFLLLPACTAGEDGADNDLSGNRGEAVLLQPRFYAGQPSTRSVVNGLESSDAVTNKDKISSVMLYVTESNGYPFYQGVKDPNNKLKDGLSLFKAKGSGTLSWTGAPAVNLYNLQARVFAFSPSDATFNASTTSDEHTIEVTIPADMTFNGGNSWQCSTVDFLYGSGSSDIGSNTSITASNAEGAFSPTIHLQHALAQVVFKLQSAPGRLVDNNYDYVKKITLNTASNIFVATANSATTTMKLKDGTLGATTGIGELTFTPNPMATAVKCGENGTPAVVGYGLVAPLASKPTDVSFTIVLGKTTDTANERHLVIKAANFQQIQWERGYRYTYNLILSDRNIAVGNITIDKWNKTTGTGTLPPDGF
ncbi:fimbrillin family protein [uncultured Parabacteroides sp.]|uniref:fimbrillin family protein n=1 Tax=uncultured Parabacteroides sp. TaxID=512312 RepID=UPI0025960AA4|nr:fimbrillin family protein [uncultured Parabacteroides sp.]